MTVIGVKGDGGEGGGATVLVGIKFDADSKQLLTWALVKVVQPGDQVIALHILDSATESPVSILSLVKQFDYTLAVYEGFCNLKQASCRLLVDLKLKVCRGSSPKKSLLREAKSFEAAKLILGTTKTHNPIQSSTSVAKFCAKKLPKCFSVYAVQNGKIVFQREAIETNTNRSQDNDSPDKSLTGLVSLPKSVRTNNGSFPHKSGLFARHKTVKKNCEACASALQLPENSNSQSPEELSGNCSVGNRQDLIPFQTSEGNDVLVRKFPGWSLLHWAFLPKRHHSENSAAKKSVDQWVLRLPSQHSSVIVYPDLRQNRLFSYQELLEATSSFMPENMVGKGGSSHVYRGCLPDGKELAVKIVKPTENAIKEFVQEIEILTSLNHKNLISLFGFCFEENKLLLVYDFLSRGSLEENLHVYRFSVYYVFIPDWLLLLQGNKKDTNAFGWQERYKVAVGLAEALDYLHNGCEQPVIHRDVKSSNILLSNDFEPQLSDFGLASRVSSSASHTTSMDVAGTFGYLAPEYLMHGKMSDKIDVYAFGIVLLELLSGKKPIDDNLPKGQESLVMWAKPILKDSNFSQLLDPELGSSYECHQIKRMIVAATLCIRRAPLMRPQVSIILKLLQGDQEVTNWAQEVKESEEVDIADDELYPTNMESHLNLALLGLEEDSRSSSSNEQSFQIEEYLQKRWSRSSSFV
ncbi:Kinase protein with adenine nucleotide alpha hydrolases-like domain, putative isoform 5 [Hibiscus syriacus]|uniref:Kinase protein with adenine nucleotide alpha hydrolases-like domain, putative isoform 5 n=1 Tax=Hibiscus syriacus TaxID=106335 RepID=A0A6A3A9G6_HIBSY|nr:Kinase protein with adenine nucleotide alpha hydrolases-like domain, putative isoform 5 [Hibiscus syriacus]